MTLYKKDKDGSFIHIGSAAANSMYDLNGSSYVHINKDKREMFGLPNEPYDWFFDTYREALDWVNEIVGPVYIGY